MVNKRKLVRGKNAAPLDTTDTITKQRAHFSVVPSAFGPNGSRGPFVPWLFTMARFALASKIHPMQAIADNWTICRKIMGQNPLNVQR